MDAKAKDGTALAVSGDVMLGLWQAPASMERWKWHMAELERLAAQNSQGILYLDFILPSSSPPDSTLRATMQEDFRRLGPRLRKLVVVPLGDGLWLSVVRTIVRATLVISGQSKQYVVASTIEQGLDRIREFATPETPSSIALRASVATLFRSLGAKQAEVV
jgi:hypothetical protein